MRDKKQKRHMNQNIIIILKQGWTNLLPKCIIKNQTKQKLELKALNLLIELT
jgi:hypothetical protein